MIVVIRGIRYAGMQDALRDVEQQERLLLLQWKAAISATCMRETAQCNKQNTSPRTAKRCGLPKPLANDGL